MSVPASELHHRRVAALRGPRTLLAAGLAALLAAASPALHAQEAAPTGGALPAADPADVESVDAILEALYDVISGPAGQARDWDRFRSLFRSEARLIPVVRPQGEQEAGRRPVFLSVEDYVERSGPFLEERGFFEREIGRVEERFGDIVHAFSAYESRWTPEGEVFQRGINSIQLAFDGTRWWIVNILWQGVGPEEPIPERYLRRSSP